MYEIYIIKNDINEKVYIGQTRQGIRERFKSHLKCKSSCAIHNAIRKYGKEHFYVEKLCDCSSQEELNEMEKFYIKKFNSLSPNGYNLTTGGQQFEFTEEIKLKISQNTKVAMQKEEIREKCRKKPEGWLENVKRAMNSEEVRAKIRHSNSVRDRTDSNLAISSSVKKLWNNPEYREKQRISKQGVDKNSLFQCSDAGKNHYRELAYKEWNDAEYREKMMNSRYSSDKCYNEEWRRNISKTTKAAMRSPKQREKYLRGYITYLVNKYGIRYKKLIKFLDEYALYNKKYRRYCQQAFNW